MPCSLGGAALWGMDKVLPHLHIGYPVEEAEGPSTRWRRAVLLVTAITLHNIPEGLAVGVAFGGADTGMASAGVGGAIALSLGIAMQNFPEGLELIPESHRAGNEDLATVSLLVGFVVMMVLDVALG